MKQASATSALLILAVPVVVENVLGFLVGLADVVLLGRLGAPALAGLGAASSLFALTNAIGFALMTGGVVEVARAVGRDDRPAAAAAGGAVMLAFFLAGIAILAVGYPLADDLVGLMGLEPDAAAEGTAFFRCMAWVPLLTFFTPAGRVILLGHGRTRRTLLLSLVQHGLHLALLPVLILQLELGAAGVALAFLISGFVAGLLGLHLLRIEGLAVRVALDDRTRQALAEIWRLGAPSAGEILLYLASQSMVMRLTALLGTSVVAARVLITRLFTLSVAVQAALGQASLIHTGQESERSGRLGAWRGAEAALRIAVGAALFTAVVFMLLPGAFVAELSTDGIAVAWTVLLLPLAILQLLPQAVNIVVGGALRGAGSTRWMLMTQAVGLVIVTACSWLFAFPLGLGLLGIFLGVAADEYLRALWNYRRLRYRLEAAAP
jgi:putative MATE family efflux protein